MSKCPRCDSPAPHLHPAMQFEGEVQPCTHPYHQQDTPQNHKYLTPQTQRDANPIGAGESMSVQLNLSNEVFETIVAAIDCAIGTYKELSLKKELTPRLREQFAAQAKDAEEAYEILESYR